MWRFRVASDRYETALYSVGFWAGLALFLWMATDALAWLGPYFDEWIFVPVSLHFLGECDVEAAIGYRFGCIPWMQAPPYVGVVKALLSAPFFAIWGVSEWTVRLPPILLSLVMFWAVGRFLHRRLGVWVVPVLLLMTTDIVFIEQARFDWGPVVVATFCKLLGFAALWRWLERGRRIDLVLLLTFCIVGLFDKLSFVWVVLAYAVGVLLVWPDRLMIRIREMRRVDVWIVVFAGIALIFIAVKLILPAMALKLPGQGAPRDWHSRAMHVVDLFDITFSGAAVRQWVFNDPAHVSSVPRFWLLGQVILGIGVLIWRWRQFVHNFAALRMLAFSTVVMLVLFVLLVYTPEVGGAHHLIVLWPYHWIHFGALLLAFDERLVAQKTARRAVGGLVVVLMVVLGIHRWNQWSEAVIWWRGERGASPLFDPALVQAANAINAMPEAVVVSTQWGLHQALVSFGRSERRSQYQDWSWSLASLTDKPKNFVDHLRRRIVDLDEVVLVSWIPPIGPTPSSEWRDELLGPMAYCVKQVYQFESSRGESLILVERLGFSPLACQPGGLPLLPRVN